MGLRVVNALVYATLAVLGVASLAPRLGPAVHAVADRWSYAPTLTLPWLWLALAAALALLLALAANRLFSGRPVGRALYAALLAASLAAFAARHFVAPAARPSAADAAPHLLARVEAAADRVHARDHLYPTDPAPLADGLPDILRDLGYRRRGALRLETRVHVVPDAQGPVLRNPEGVRPGDVVFAVDPSRRRYWITAFVLDARGRLGPAVDEAGRVRFAAGIDGRATTRLDPLFPEYPRRSTSEPKPAPKPETSPEMP